MAGEGKRLGELLVEKRLVTEEQLKAALEEQRTTKEFLGSLLVRKGRLRREDLLQTLAEQMGLPFVRLDLERVDWAVAKRFSPTAVIEHKSLPIAMDRTSVTVAVVNPLDLWGIESIEREASGRVVRMVLVDEEDFKLALQRYRQRS